MKRHRHGDGSRLEAPFEDAINEAATEAVKALREAAAPKVFRPRGPVVYGGLDLDIEFESLNDAEESVRKAAG